MSNFNLQKEVEKAKFVVNKRGVPTQLRASVVMDLDVSGSAQDLFYSGLMQEAFQRILPIGITFDDNQEIDVYTFSKGDTYTSHIEPNATVSNFSDYIKKNILDNNKVPKWSGTSYAPVLRENLRDLQFYKKSLFGGFGNLQQKSKTGTPAIIYFFTDGVNDDESETQALLAECEKAKTEVYFMFVGIGGADFPFIERMGEKFSNVGFLDIKNLKTITNDDAIYDKLLPEELTVWLKDYV